MKAKRWSTPALYLIEILIVALFGYRYSSDYITLPRAYVPTGGDYNVSIFGRFFWDDVRACGTCALWNGNFMGGNPAYLDVSSDLFHPVAAIPSLIWGTLYGSRVAVTLTLILGGIACWWLAQVLGAGPVARVAAGFLGVAGGHLTGRLQHGLVVLALSVATASFLLPTILLLFENPSRRNAALVGLFGGFTALSGQAYIQVALVCLAPAFGILFFTRKAPFLLICRRIVQALAIAGAVAAVQLVPVLRYWGRIGKDTDFNFPRAQAFEFVPTNLVLNDPGFYQAPILHREAGFPGLYSNYIGWGALALAIAGLVYLGRRSTPRAAFLGCFVVGALWLSSGELFKLLSRWDGHPEIQNFAAGVRTPSNMANIAVPAIIGLAAVGLQYLTDTARSWRRLHMRSAIRGHSVQVTISLAMLVPLLAFVIVRDVAHQGKTWMVLENWDNNPESQLAASLTSDELRWIRDESLNPRLQILAPIYQLKLSPTSRPWWIDGKESPIPWGILGATGDVPGYERISSPQMLVREAGNPYAQNFTDNGHVVNCVATGRGGNIDIECPGGPSGLLMIEEHAFPGWHATVNGKPARTRVDATWVAIELPDGGSHIELDFRPRAFWVGAALSSLGLLWALWWIVFPGLLANPRPWARVDRQKTTPG